MKLILLAAAAAIAMPAMAQTSGSTGTSSPTSNGGAGTPTETRNSANDSMQTTPAPTSTMPDQSMSSTTAPMPAAPMADGTDPVGGYQPATPAMSGPMQPGATVTFQQAPSPDQAYPAPAPMAKYPVCKKGEFDNCMNGPRSTHSSEVRGRSSR